MHYLFTAFNCFKSHFFSSPSCPPWNCLHDDIVATVFSNFSMERDLQRFRKVCHQWKKQVDQLNEKRDLECEKFGIFGVNEWKKRNVNIGNVPYLRKEILERVSLSIQIGEIPLWVLIPSKINGKAFDFEM